jgi:acetyl-CoA C-acetyltransferase
MALTAETLATDFGIDRRAQDEFAASSQQKTAAATRAGRWTPEIVAVQVPQRKGPPTAFVEDESPRPDTTVDALARLQPAFKPDGTVTAGNASTVNDGAAAVVLLSGAEARRRGIRPMAKLVSWASVGVEPARMGLGPVPATRAALTKAGLALADIGAIELNEAFAAQSLAVIRKLDLDPARVNRNGGAIALGHPVGASGARILVTLLHILTAADLRFGLATLCVGGGQGVALVVERA